MNENEMLTEYERLIYATVQKYTYKIDEKRTCNTFEDLLQEGRIAALKAIRTYSTDHRTKLSTYIVNCVRNRLRDLNKKANAKKNPVTQHFADMTPFEKGTTDDEETFNTKMTLDAYLESDDFKMICPVLDYGCTVNDLVRDVQEKRLENVDCEYEKRKVMKESREEVVACLSRVQQVLRLKGVNLRSSTVLKLVR